MDATAARALGGAHLITRDTNLRIDSFNAAAGVTLTIVARSIGFDGQPIVDIFAHTPNTDRSIKTTTETLSEGWLVSMQAYASSGSPRRGQCFVRVQLIQGFTGATLSLATVLQGYVQDTTALAWPGSEITQSTEGRGVIRSITGTDPAAGVEISETVPTNARWRVLAFRATLTTDATVANRVPILLFDDGTTDYLRSPINGNETASVAWINSWAAFGTSQFSTSAAELGVLPPDVILVGGHRIRTSTTAIVAGDNWGAPQYLVEEWIED